MRPIVQTLSDASGGTLYGNPIALDYFANPNETTISVLVTGTATYTVQYTFDLVNQTSDWTPATGNWVNHPTLTAQTATKDANLAYPVTAIRIQQTAGSGSVRLTAIQSGY
jgi:hypothetical protein